MSFIDALGDDDMIDDKEAKLVGAKVVAKLNEMETNSAVAGATKDAFDGVDEIDNVDDEDYDEIVEKRTTRVKSSNVKTTKNSRSSPDPVLLKVGSALRFVGSALGALAVGSWRGIVHGEKLKLSSDEVSALPKPERWIKPIGASNGTRSEYTVRWNNDRSFWPTAGWWMREAHHDPLGTDPMMMSMLSIAFVAGMFYATFIEGLLFCLILEAIEWITWLSIRAYSKVMSAELDVCESRGIAMVYNFLVFPIGLILAKFVLYTWSSARHHKGSLHTIWEALIHDKHCDADSGVFLVWAPCTDAVLFITMALLFLCIIFASFGRLYVPSLVMLALLVPFAAVTGATYHVFNTLVFTIVTCFYFLACTVKPIKGTYVLNLFISIAFYLFVYCISALSAGFL